MNTKGTTPRKLQEVNTTPYEGTELGMALQNFNASVRNWNATIEKMNAEAEAPAPRTPSTFTTILKTWIGWALFLAAASLAGIVIEVVIR